MTDEDKNYFYVFMALLLVVLICGVVTWELAR